MIPDFDGNLPLTVTETAFYSPLEVATEVHVRGKSYLKKSLARDQERALHHGLGLLAVLQEAFPTLK